MLAVLALSCGGSGYSSTPSTPAPAATPTPATGAAAHLLITIAGDRGQMSYSPAAASVRVGQTVAWRNADTAAAHTATQDGRRFDTGTIARGATSAPIAMTAAGTYPYHCEFHPGMIATLTVTQ